ncbi:MAG: hypothetical protein C0504_12505 [Candidatus Solibacter sp.]|nr:hypothetical protein [Candidatus Solibacter sp.]
MKRRLTLAVAAAALLLGTAQLSAHDDKIHKATIGEVAAATADGLDLKTKTGIVKVKYSSKTKFELNEKHATKAGVRIGERVGVIGTKLPTGEIMANEVILGVPAPAAAAQKKESHKH